MYKIHIIRYNNDTRLKKKIENNASGEGAFYQSEWVKINWNRVTLVFSLCVAAIASE